MSALHELEIQLLLLVNHLQLSPGLHSFMIELTTANNSKWLFSIAVPFLLLFLIYKYRWLGARIVLFGAALAGLADTFNYRIIKSLMHRDRPQHVIDEVILRVSYSPVSSSFPSNHATTTMALAVWFSYFFPKGSPIFYLIAFLTGVSRVYVGVHYPSDVISGWLIGATLGAAFVWVYRRYSPARP